MDPRRLFASAGAPALNRQRLASACRILLVKYQLPSVTGQPL